jgi:hypothetical protein
VADPPSSGSSSSCGATAIIKTQTLPDLRRPPPCPGRQSPESRWSLSMTTTTEATLTILRRKRVDHPAARDGVATRGTAARKLWRIAQRRPPPRSWTFRSSPPSSRPRERRRCRRRRRAGPRGRPRIAAGASPRRRRGGGGPPSRWRQSWIACTGAGWGAAGPGRRQGTPPAIYARPAAAAAAATGRCQRSRLALSFRNGCRRPAQQGRPCDSKV